jgi:hypothetical protein
MNEFERNLSRLRPEAAGLNSDAVTYAAGLAAGRRGRNCWAGVSCLFAVAVVGLGLWGWSERVERHQLAARMGEQLAPAVVPANSAEAISIASSPAGYFHLRRQAERDPNHWLSALPSVEPVGVGGPEPVILRAWSRDGLIE